MTGNGNSTIRTVKQFVAENPAFTYGGMRKLIYFEDTNGMKASGAVLRIGRKVLIDVDCFYNWLKNQNGL